MPKVVDHDARRLEIADALLAVVRREGVAAVSVRTVAAEAGLSVGAMRHTAASQGELLAFAMGVVAERVAGRVAARAAAGPADLDALTDVLGEVLSPAPPGAPSAPSAGPAAPRRAAPARDEGEDLWARSQAGVAPLKKKR